MQLNFILLCRIFILGSLTILVLPFDFLIPYFVISVFLAIFCFIRKSPLLGLLLLLLALNIARIIDFTNILLPANKFTAQITITQLLKQQNHYQTAVAKFQDHNIFIRWNNKTPLILGAKYQVELKFRPLESRLNEGNFSRQKYLIAKEIIATANIYKAKLLEQPNDFRSNLLYQTIDRTQNLATQDILLALSLGERAWLKEEHQHLLQHTSTSHLIAISGLHTALVFVLGLLIAKALLFTIFYIFNVFKKAKFTHFSKTLVQYFPLFFATSLAIFYSFLAGFSLPTLRAIFAILVIVFLQLIKKHYTAWQIWQLVVAGLILISPFNLLSDSFWLSILAVLSLIIWYRIFPLAKFLEYFPSFAFKKFYKAVFSLIHLQIGILLLFGFVQVYWFQGFAGLGFLANLVIVPIFSFVLVPLLLVALFSPLHLANLLWQVANFITLLCLEFLDWLDNFWLELSNFEQLMVFTINLVVFFAFLFFVYRFKSLIYQGLTVTLVFVIFLIFEKNKTVAPKWLTFDVGQGLAQALIYQENKQLKAILYDAGSSWLAENSIVSMADLEILPFLKKNNIRVEAVFLSHDDNDHSGGITAILKAFPKVEFYSSSNKIYNKIKPKACKVGQSWKFGNWQLTALSPSSIGSRSYNQDSCVIIAKIYQHKILLTGDITKNEEADLIKQNIQADFLQVAHHGSKTSSSKSFLEKIDPKIAIISSAKANRFKLPNKEVIKNLNDLQIAWYNTADKGMISVTFSDSDFQLNFMRNYFTPWYNQVFRSINNL